MPIGNRALGRANRAIGIRVELIILIVPIKPIYTLSDMDAHNNCHQCQRNSWTPVPAPSRYRSGCILTQSCPAHHYMAEKRANNCILFCIVMALKLITLVFPFPFHILIAIPTPHALVRFISPFPLPRFILLPFSASAFVSVFLWLLACAYSLTPNRKRKLILQAHRLMIFSSTLFAIQASIL